MHNFVHGTSMREIHTERKPGVLRKVITPPNYFHCTVHSYLIGCKFDNEACDMEVTINNSTKSLRDLMLYHRYTLRAIKQKSTMKVYGAVIDQRGNLVNNNTYVAYQGQNNQVHNYWSTILVSAAYNLNYNDIVIHMQMEYGRLLSCLMLDDQSSTCTRICLVHCHERVEAGGAPILNDRDCPLLFQLPMIEAIPSTAIIGAVSIIHECSHRCRFKQGRTARKAEREEVSSDLLVYEHVFNSTEYCLNVYYTDTP